MIRITVICEAKPSGLVRLTKAIAKLPEREQPVPMLYSEQELTMSEVGKLLGAGESRVAQTHRLAVKHLGVVM